MLNDVSDTMIPVSCHFCAPRHSTAYLTCWTWLQVYETVIC